MTLARSINDASRSMNSASAPGQDPVANISLLATHQVKRFLRAICPASGINAMPFKPDFSLDSRGENQRCARALSR